MASRQFSTQFSVCLSLALFIGASTLNPAPSFAASAICNPPCPKGEICRWKSDGTTFCGVPPIKLPDCGDGDPLCGLDRGPPPHVQGKAPPPAAKNFVTHLDSSQEVPTRDCPGQGQAVFKLSKDGSELSYTLIASNIDNVVAAHIHLGVAGVNGPVVLFLFGPAAPDGGRQDGVLGEGRATAADLVGPLAGMDLSVLVAAMEVGGTYVNVHTNDGIAPPNEGCGDFPGGEIRGQIFAAGP